MICLKCEILIIDTRNEYTKKSDRMVNLFFYREFNVRMPIFTTTNCNYYTLLYLTNYCTLFLQLQTFSTYTTSASRLAKPKKNKDVVITKPDKANEVVILDRKLYNSTIKEIISDTSKFEKLSEDPTLKRRASLQRFLRKLKQKNFFNEIEYDELYPSASANTRIYGTPKMQQFSSSDSFPKLCPIVSSIGTFNYNLVHFLCDLLSPLVPNDYSCRYTFSFVSQIKNANLSKKFLVSYDVTSLFTNILLQETIGIAINLIFNHNPNLNITRKEF